MASYVPSTSPLYLEVTTDFDGAPVDRRSRRSPSSSRATRSSQRTIDEALRSEDVDFETEIKPLLGERAAIAGLAAPRRRRPPGPLDRAPTRPTRRRTRRRPRVRRASSSSPTARPQQVKDLLVQEGASRGASATAWSTSPRTTRTAWSRSPTARSSSPTPSSSCSPRSTPTRPGGDQTLAGTDKFTDALAKLPAEVFGQAYLDIGAFVQRSRIARRPAGSSSSAWTTTSDAVMAASIAAEPEGARMKGVVLGAPTVVSRRSSRPALTDTAPADALAYLGFSNLSGTLSQVFQQVQGSLGDEERRQLEGLSGQLPQLLGVSLDDLSALAEGEHALVVTAGARRRARRSPSRWRTARRRRRPSTSCAPGSRRS